jgi:hypothetical protein
MPIALTVHMEPHEEHYMHEGGFRMNDDRRSTVARFVAQNGIPDSDLFVCVAVHEEGNIPPYVQGYGDIELRLRDDLVAEIRVACDGDYQDVACQGAAKKTVGEQAGYVKRFHDLSDLPPHEKRQRLESLVASSSGMYVEARLFRAITPSDVQARKDHSFAGNLERIMGKFEMRDPCP